MNRYLSMLLLACMLWGAVWAADAPAPVPVPRTKINAKDGAAMVLIPAGNFLMGTSKKELAAWHPKREREWFTDEMPQHTVYLDAFYMYKNDVTVAEYRTFCRATKRDMPPFTPDGGWHDNHPVVNVTWDDAKAYATWAGATLPTEAQWEKAARGGKQHTFVWGDACPPPKGAGNFADATLCATGKYASLMTIGDYTDGYVYTSPVGSFSANGYGLSDMAGNVFQWCSDWYGKDYYTHSPARNPTGPKTGKMRVHRGNSWYNLDPSFLRVTGRAYGATDFNDDVGFRCAVCLVGR